MSFPLFVTALSQVPSANHPLGFRGGAEDGITPVFGVIATPSSMRWPTSASSIDMPAMPEGVWRVIGEARKQPDLY